MQASEFTPVRMGKIHAAKLESSPRLQRVLNALYFAGGFIGGEGWLSTRDIISIANVCAVNSAIAELRANGIAVESRCVGRGRYEYRLAEAEVKA